MVKDDPTPGRAAAFRLAALALVTASLSGTGFLMCRLFQAPDTAGAAGGGAAPLFHLWPRDRQPDLVLLLSGETYSYLQPCGCSKPQYGGLERRYNFLKGLTTQRQWPVVSLDLGDVAQRNGPQALVKYVYSMKAYRMMGYTAVGIGRNEMAMPLIDALSEYALNNPSPRVLAANLLKREENFPTMMKSCEVVTARPGAPKVGVVAVVAPGVAKEVQDQTIRFADVEKAIPEALRELQGQNPELLVLLFQGSEDEAKKCTARIPQFKDIQCLTAEDEPPDKPDQVGNTLIVRVGHKGRNVGTLGVYRTGRANPPFAFYYQRVALGPEFETPAGQEADNPVLASLEDYTKEVKAGNYLSHYAKTDHPIQRVYQGATYVGSAKCKSCHKEAYRVWQASPHARAYETLEKARRPSLRQYDGECVACHVTGFAYNGGFSDEKATPHLKDNGCENCHGPGSLHVKQMTEGAPPDARLLALMNPFKTPPSETPAAKAQRLNRLDASCQKCHDIDNDVHWKIDKWVEGKIIHMEPKGR
jgi:hypothetical protein